MRFRPQALCSFLLVVLLCCPSPTHAQEKTRVAVVDFDEKGGLNEKDAGAVAIGCSLAERAEMQGKLENHLCLSRRTIRGASVFIRDNLWLTSPRFLGYQRA